MNNSYTKNNTSFLSQVISMDSLVLWIVLIVFVPLTIFFFASLKAPIIDWLNNVLSAFKPDRVDIQIPFPNIPLELLFFGVVSLLVSLFSFVVIQSRYVINWFSYIDKKDIYVKENFLSSVSSLASWTVYRFIYIFFPLIVMGVISFTLLFLAINLFNIVAQIMGINLEIVMITGIFSAITICFFWFIALLFSAKNLVISLYGSSIAVLDPHINNVLIKNRSKRLAFSDYGSWFLYLIYICGMIIFYLEIFFLLLNPTFFSLKTLPLILVLEIINICMFIIVGRFLTFSYYKSLLIKHAKIAANKSILVSKI